MTESVENKSLAREGIKLLLNNKFEEAKELFSVENQDIQMAAGYCFLTFMNALMSFEEGKLEESLQTLRDIERRCSQDFGWLKSMKNKVLSTFNYCDEDLAEKLEKQIILGDSHLCVALLTFLQQDLTSYVKGGWVLMKAWKVYQDTYTQILNLYKKTFGCDASIPGSQFLSWEFVRKSSSNFSLVSTSTNVTNKPLSVPSTPVGDSNPTPSSSYGNEVIVEPHVVARLMAAVSFGYGIFQLCISLLPSSFLKLIHFLGFEGGREAGLSALMFSREGTDMRGPLATLTLLWYHTIVMPFFAVNSSNVQAGVNEAELLIKESEDEFGDSALFLFFKGRVQRLKSNIPEALKAYESAIDKSNQREIQLLCLHEVGWCYLIQLDWGNAFHCFNQLRTRSKWSQSFYTYLNMVCIGALGDLDQAHKLSDEVRNLLNEESAVPQIKTFISRRIRKFQTPPPSEQSETGEEGEPLINKLSCELLLLELLYFWNALPSCNPHDLKNVLDDCRCLRREPMPGLCNLIEGAVYVCMSDTENAVACFRKCLEKRVDIKSDAKSNPDDNDDHISAFALFELATILVQKPETLEEGKSLLVRAQNDYKVYDFEYRLTIRINSMLKKIN